jgi:proline iminopeptidase
MEIIEESKNLLLGVGASPSMYLLIGASVLAVAVTLERLWAFHSLRDDVFALSRSTLSRLARVAAPRCMNVSHPEVFSTSICSREIKAGGASLYALRVLFTLSLGLFACNAPATLVPPTVDEDPTLPSVELNGTRLHLEESGRSTGTPIIFLHGGPGNDSAYMRPLGKTCPGGSLGDSHRLVFWDQRGVGLSRRHPASEISYALYLADLDAVVNHVDPDQHGVIFIGHSWGGAYAAGYLGRHPERVRAAALLEPRALTEELDNGLPNAGNVDLTKEWVNDLAWSDEFLTPDSHAAADLQIMLAVFSAQDFRRTLEPMPVYRFGAAVIDELVNGRFYPKSFNLAPEAKAYSGEVLILASDDENGDLSAEFQKRQLEFFSSPTLEVISGGGHDDLANSQACQSVERILAYFARVGQ